MYNTIILPLDGSSFAELAIETGADIARRAGARLVLVRVHESYIYENTDYLITADESRRDQEGYLAEVAKRIEGEHELRPDQVLLEGPIASSLCEFAEQSDTPLIVVSTHGRTGFSRLWLGSVADAIARYAHTPVLMLRHRRVASPAEGSPHLFKRILVPLDGSDLAEAALPHARALASTYGARLTLVRAVVSPSTVPASLYAVPYVAPPELLEDTEGFRAELAQNYLGAVSARMRHEDTNLLIGSDVRMSESPARAIVDSARAHEADTVVMATHGRGASRLVVASVADKVLRAGPEAVLLVRPVGG